MKKNLFLLIPCVITLLTTSCSNDEITPEVSIPKGSINYFENSIDFDNHANEKSISFVSNVPWTISVDETRNGDEWCIVSPAQGEAGTANITIRVTENLSYDDRNAVLRLSYGDSIKNIFVNQKQLDALILTANRFEMPSEGGFISVEVKANIDYTVIIDDIYKDWIQQTTSPSVKSLSNNTLYFQIAQTEEYNQRKGEIIIKSENKSDTVSIYQAGEGILSLTNKEFNLNSSEQNVVIEVNSNFEYGLEMPNVNWISEILTRGMSTHTINLHISANSTYDNRTATIRLYDKNSNISENIIINQSQKDTIQISDKEFEFDEKGGSFTVETNSNVNYNVKISEEWITESPYTRSLSKRNHTFNVLPLTENIDRETKITLSDTNKGVTEEIIVRQKRSIFFDKTYYQMLEGNVMQLNLTNRTDSPVIFESSDESVVTINAEGILTALGKGNSTITATTQNGQHKCTCEISVNDITSYVHAYNLGGSTFIINGVLQRGSKLNWKFVNNSNENLLLKTAQLIGGDGQESNEMDVNTVVSANSSVSFSTTIGILGISTPVTCKFRFEYDGKDYFITAVYNN